MLDAECAAKFHIGTVRALQRLGQLRPDFSRQQLRRRLGAEWLHAPIVVRMWPSANRKARRPLSCGQTRQGYSKEQRLTSVRLLRAYETRNIMPWHSRGPVAWLRSTAISDAE